MELHESIEKAKKKFNNKNQVDESLPFLHYCVECFNNCSPSSYGSKIQNRIKRDYKFENLTTTANQGDSIVTPDSIIDKFPCLKVGDRFELKSSYLYKGDYSDSYNFMQLRPFQEFEYYVLLAIDIDYNEKDVNLEWYVLNKSDVNSDNFKLYSSHGTEEIIKQNTNVEYKLHIVKNSIYHQRLKELNLL